MIIDSAKLIDVLRNRRYLADMQKDPEKWRKLRITNLNNEQFSEILQLLQSEGLFQIITDLDVSHNQLTELPESLGQLPQLKHLDVSHNQLRELPESLKNLTLETCLVNDNAVLLKEPIKIKQQENESKRRKGYQGRDKELSHALVAWLKNSSEASEVFATLKEIQVHLPLNLAEIVEQYSNDMPENQQRVLLKGRLEALSGAAHKMRTLSTSSDYAKYLENRSTELLYRLKNGDEVTYYLDDDVFQHYPLRDSEPVSNAELLEEIRELEEAYKDFDKVIQQKNDERTLNETIVELKLLYSKIDFPIESEDDPRHIQQVRLKNEIEALLKQAGQSISSLDAAEVEVIVKRAKKMSEACAVYTKVGAEDSRRLEDMRLEKALAVLDKVGQEIGHYRKFESKEFLDGMTKEDEETLRAIKEQYEREIQGVIEDIRDPKRQGGADGEKALEFAMKLEKNSLERFIRCMELKRAIIKVKNENEKHMAHCIGQFSDKHGRLNMHKFEKAKKKHEERVKKNGVIFKDDVYGQFENAKALNKDLVQLLEQRISIVEGDDIKQAWDKLLTRVTECRERDKKNVGLASHDTATDKRYEVMEDKILAGRRGMDMSDVPTHALPKTRWGLS